MWIVEGSTEPVFVDLVRGPGIDSQHGGPVRQPYLSYRPARLHMLAESVHRNRFLGSINVYKYELSTYTEEVLETGVATTGKQGKIGEIGQ